MYGNQYIFGSGGERNWEKHRKRAGALQCLPSFIAVIYSLFSLPLLHKWTYSLPYIETHPWAHIQYMHSNICARQERKKENMSRWANYPPRSLHLSLCSCAVCNIITTVLLRQLAWLCICHIRSVWERREKWVKKWAHSSIDFYAPLRLPYTSYLTLVLFI